MVRSGEIGSLKAIVGTFSYFNRDPANIRNVAEFGDGSLMDIGCYPIQIARFLFEAEPVSVAALMERDPDWGIDRLTSAILGFPSGGHCAFTCSTQLVLYQRIQILGTRSRVEVELPFNAPSDRSCRLLVDDGQDLRGGGLRIEEQPICDQYMIQADLFCRAVRGLAEVPTPLEDSLANMTVIELLVESARNHGVIFVR